MYRSKVEPTEDKKFAISMLVNAAYHLFRFIMIIIGLSSNTARKYAIIISGVGTFYYIWLLGYFMKCCFCIISKTKKYFIFEYRQHQCQFVSMAVILDISLLFTIFEHYAYYFYAEYPNLKKSEKFPISLVAVNTFITLAPICVYLFSKKIEDCL